MYQDRADQVLELSVHFTSDEKDETSSIDVRLFRPTSSTWTEPKPFEPPLSEAELTELRWYLETFISWPTQASYERAKQVEGQMEDWGHALLQSIIVDEKAVQMWQTFLADTADTKLLTIDSIDPRVLRLPWELLANERGHLFTQGISIRRRLKKIPGTPFQPAVPPAQVLVVVARPEGVGSINPRNVARPLINTLEELGGQAAVELLHPPTFKALADRLRDRQAPPVHVLHFDGNAVYDTSLGLGYLLFENDDHQADWVDANRLGNLLNRSGVPLAVLNACQSATQEKSLPYTSAAIQLVRAGVESVLAMGYGTTAPTMRMFLEEFYHTLVDGGTVGQATNAGRTLLLADGRRGTLVRQDAMGKPVKGHIYLRDWFLPTLYQPATDPALFIPETPPVPRALTNPTMPGGLPARPICGFHGRVGEMLQLERNLARHPIVVLHGPTGVGKTALAAEAGRWFYRTGRFPGGAAYVSFKHGGSLTQLCSWVGQALSGDPGFPALEGDMEERVAALLEEQPALVILDDLETILDPDSLMPPEERRAVLDALWTWVVGTRLSTPPLPSSQQSRILIVTQTPSFDDRRFAPSKACSHIQLDGLTTRDGLELAAAVLDSHHIDRTKVDREELITLMENLDRTPLSLYLTLPYLERYSPSELSARLSEHMSGFAEGAAREASKSIPLSLSLFHQNLDEGAQKILADLAIFRGGGMENVILDIIQADSADWQAARAALEQAALITVEFLPNIDSPFLRFHAHLQDHLSPLLSDSRRAELEERYWQAYYQQAVSLYRSDAQNPQRTRAVAVRELPNLRHTLNLATAAGQMEEAMNFSTTINHFLDLLGRWWEREKIMERLVTTQVAEEEGLTRAEYLMLNMRGEALLQQDRALEGERLFRGLLKRLETSPVYDSEYEHAYTLWNLGRCLTEQGQSRQAIAFHKQALGEFDRLSESSQSAYRMTAACHVDWASNLMLLDQFDKAEEHYELAREIFREMDDLRSVGIVFSRLGDLALARGNTSEAGRQYTKALETFRALDEPREVATQWHQLGKVAQEMEDWDGAERCYREALRIREQTRDKKGMVQTLIQIAHVTEMAHRPQEAEGYYLKALERVEEQEDLARKAKILNSLAAFYLSQSRLDAAARIAHQALEIDKAIGDPSVEIWKDYAILAQIAEAQGQTDEAAQWRRREQESFIA